MGKRRDLFEFRWDVYADEYKWLYLSDLESADPTWFESGFSGPKLPFLRVPYAGVRWPASPAEVVTGARPPDSRIRTVLPTARRYAPLKDHSALFLTFSSLKPTETAIIEFARTYGHLGVPVVMGRSASVDDIAGEVYGEPFWEWTNEIHHMREVVDVWTIMRKRNLPVLRERFSVTSDRSIHYSRRSPESALTYAVTHRYRKPELRDVLDAERTMDAAKAFVQVSINERVQEYTCGRLLWNEEWEEPSVHIVPFNLLGALWLQLADAVTGTWKFRQCDFCKTWFEVAPQGQGRERVFCSNSCRGKAYRKRKEKQEADR